MSWYEVESKIRIKSPDEMRIKLNRIARFLYKKKRADKYFELDKGYPKKAFRIRAEENNFVVNFKKWIKELWDKEVVVKEEFEISLTKEELDTLMELFKDLGFKEWLLKDKECEVYEYNKDKKLHIELNKVRKLGYFLEIEYLCDKSKIEKARKIIKEVLKGLGINKKDIDNTGYTKLLWSLRKKARIR